MLPRKKNEDVDYYNSEKNYEDDDFSENSNESMNKDAFANPIFGNDSSSLFNNAPETNHVDFPYQYEISAQHALPLIFRSHRCRTCKTIFPSNNKLHQHIRNGCPNNTITHTILKTENPLANATFTTRKRNPPSMVKTPITTAMAASVATPIVINSSIDPNKDIGTGYGFRGWKYATINVSLYNNPSNALSEERKCLDTGTGIIIADEVFFKRQTKNQIPVRTMATPIIVRGINFNKHATDQYVIVPINLSGMSKGNPAIARFRREIHLAQDLKANILLKSDVLGPQQVTIDLEKIETHIVSCDVTISIDIGSRNKISAVQQAVYIRQTTVLPFHSIKKIPIHYLDDVSKNKNHLFELDDIDFSLYVHLMDVDTSAILIWNYTSKTLQIFRNFRLGYVTELNYSNACHVAGENAKNLALRRPKKEHKTSWFKKL